MTSEDRRRIMRRASRLRKEKQLLSYERFIRLANEEVDREYEMYYQSVAFLFDGLELKFTRRTARTPKTANTTGRAGKRSRGTTGALKIHTHDEIAAAIQMAIAGNKSRAWDHCVQ